MAIPLLSRKPDSGLGNIRSSPGAPSRNIDWVLFLGQAALTVAGCCIVFSATQARTTDPYLYVTRQVIFAIAAGLVMVIAMSIDYEWLKEHVRILYVGTVGILALLFVGGLGSSEPMLGFDVGPIQVQPAEFAKLTVLLMLCAHLAEERSDELSYSRFLGGLLVVGVPAGLVILQPDLGSGSVLVAMTMGVMLVAGAKARHIFVITMLALATVGAALVSGLIEGYQLNRIRVFFDPDNPDYRDLVYQVDNATKAAGTGGLFGKGWLQGPLTNGGDIPVLWADFPFAAVGEQFGLVGCAGLLAVFAMVLLRVWRIAHLSRDLFGTYICAGVFTMMLWQLFQNVGMTIGIMPVTGLPMPFISYGGSGLITWFVMLGVVQSIHMRRMR